MRSLLPGLVIASLNLSSVQYRSRVLFVSFYVLCRDPPLFHAGCENSPQPFHGTWSTPLMTPTKSRPWDWHLPAPSSCFVARLTALRSVVIWGMPGLDWLWGHCQPPCRFPEVQSDSVRLRFTFVLLRVCHNNSRGLSVAPPISARPVLGLRSWPLWKESYAI